jgi:hypothetical protein
MTLSVSPTDPPRLLTPRILLCLGLTLTVTAAAFIKAYADLYEDYYFWSVLLKSEQPAIYALLGVFLFLLIAPLRQALPRLANLPDIVGRHPLAISATCFLILAFLSRFAYLATPISQDEYSPWLQAHIFAAGDLSAKLPVELIDHLISPIYRGHFFAVNQHNGELVSTYWPGFALLMAPFAWLGMPWLCNPLIVALNLLLSWRLGRDVFESQRAAGWVLLLMIASPAVMLNGISFYSMPAHLLCNTLFVWLLLQATPQRYFLAGIVGALASALHNPFPHLVFALPWIVWAFMRGRLRLLIILAAGYALAGLPLVIGWSVFKAPIAAATLGVDPVSGLAKILAPPSQLPPADLSTTFFRTVTGLFTPPSEYLLLARSGALIKLWAWSSPLLILLAIYGCFTKRHEVLRYLAASALLTLLIYYFIRFDQGLGWGYRYFHPAYIALPMLATAALLHLEKTGPNKAEWRGLGPALALSSILITTPILAQSMHERIALALAELPPPIAGRGLYILNGSGACQTLRCDLLLNDPYLRGDIYLLNRKRDKVPDSQLLKSFPGAEQAAENEFGRSYRLPD